MKTKYCIWPNFILFFLCFYNICTVFADEIVDLEQEIAFRKSIPIESNQVKNWPDGPIVGAKSAILLDADTVTILYEKNVHEQLYPASITKLMTCLVAIEHSEMDEIVTFSKDAVFGIERDSSNVGIDPGEELTMEECLYSILLASANEVSWAVAEHVGGDLETFVNMMNTKALELGCKNTHFNNSNGLPDPEHYTSAYDMALIAQEFYKNDILSKISGTLYYTITPSEKQPDEFIMKNHHKMIPPLEFSYEYTLGGKTGFTNAARQTLVTCGEKDGMRLICVVMMDEYPDQYKDTIQLLDYGFEQFQKVNISENETTYTMETEAFFDTNVDILGSSKKILSINPSKYLMIPKTAVFSDLHSELTYDSNQSDYLAIVTYYFEGKYVGEAQIEISHSAENIFDFSNGYVTENQNSLTINTKKHVIFINIRILFFVLLGTSAAIFLFFFLFYSIKRKETQPLTISGIKKRSRRKRRSSYPYDFDKKNYRFKI